jgi:Integrase core domain
MTEELKEVCVDVGHRRVGRLMRENGIIVERTRKFKVTTDSDHTFNIAPNLLDRDFAADQQNQKWAGDISYIWTREGWLYLAVNLDLHSRRVIGWAVSNRMKRDLAIRALKMAIALRSPPRGCIFHSDRGSQYRSHDYRKIPREPGPAFVDERQGQLLRQRSCRNLLQSHQGRADLAQLGDPSPSRNRHLPIHQRLLYPAPPTFSIGREKPPGFRTPDDLNEHSEPHKYETGPCHWRTFSVQPRSSRPIAAAPGRPLTALQNPICGCSITDIILQHSNRSQHSCAMQRRFIFDVRSLRAISRIAKKETARAFPC